MDQTTKIVSLLSVIVGVMLSVAGYFAEQRLSSLDQDINKLKQADMAIDVAEKRELKAAHLSAEFATPLARAFAASYLDGAAKPLPIHIPEQIRQEFAEVLPGWLERRGLMTGSSLTDEGLKNRLVITLVIKNTGYADAVNVTINARIKTSPVSDPRQKWSEFPAKKDLGYADLWSAVSAWNATTIDIGELRGRISSAGEGRQIVLASVSGRDGLHGTVLVPESISWTDKITNSIQTQKIDESLVSSLRPALLGAEIGTASYDCKDVKS